MGTLNPQAPAYMSKFDYIPFTTVVTIITDPNNFYSFTIPNTTFCLDSTWFVNLPEPYLLSYPPNVSEAVVEESQKMLLVNEVKSVDEKLFGRKGYFRSRNNIWKEEKKVRWVPKLVSNEKKEETVIAKSLNLELKLDVENKAIAREGKMTSVMIKNIPNKFTRGMLLELLDGHCKQENNKLQSELPAEKDPNDSLSAFDFLYLPIDFASNCNKGYAFVNFTCPSAAWRLSLSWHNKQWGRFRSKKVCEITYAKLQGKEALKHHFRDTVFPCDEEEYLPVCFSPPRDGSDQKVQQSTVGSLCSSFPENRNHGN